MIINEPGRCCFLFGRNSSIVFDCDRITMERWKRALDYKDTRDWRRGCCCGCGWGCSREGGRLTQTACSAQFQAQAPPPFLSSVHV